MDQSVLGFSAGMPVPCPSIPVDIGALLLEQGHAEDNNVVGNIVDDEVNCMAPLRSSTIADLYYLLYDCSSAQWFTIDCSNRRRSLFLDLAPSCLDRLKFKLICDGPGDEVVSGAQVNKRQIGVVALAARAFTEVHQDYEVQLWQRCVLVSVLFARRGRAQCR